MFKLTINNVDYTEYILSNPEVSGQFVEDTIIGNTPSLCLKLTLDNIDGTFNELLDYPFIVNDESELIGTFFVVEAPERMTKELNVELYDSMRFGDIRYISDLTYPCTLKDQLDEMKTMIGFNVNYGVIPLNILSREINFYDNTLSIRNTLSMISESVACNVLSMPDGTLKFMQMKKSVSYHVTENDVEQYDQESKELFTISKVRFDDSIVVIEHGTDDANTLYLAQDNMYIDKQETVDYIFSIVGGLSFYSSMDFRIATTDYMRLGDIIEFDNYFSFMMLDYSLKFYNGNYNIQEINGVINTKNLETMQTEIPDIVKIRRLKVLADQNEQRLQIIALEQDEQSKKMSTFELSLDSIKQSVSSVEEEIINVKEEVVNIVAVESTRGVMFKNSRISTSLIATVYHGKSRITDIETLKREVGATARLHWKYKKFNEEEYIDIPSTSPMIGSDGFILTVSPGDIYTQASFICELQEGE